MYVPNSLVFKSLSFTFGIIVSPELSYTLTPSKGSNGVFTCIVSVFLRTSITGAIISITLNVLVIVATFFPSVAVNVTV